MLYCLFICQRECQDLAEFVRKVLGPYAINVTTATRLCSASLCQGKGRCVRQNPDSSAYLHLPPPSEVLEKVTEKVREFKYIERFICAVFTYHNSQTTQPRCPLLLLKKQYNFIQI